MNTTVIWTNPSKFTWIQFSAIISCMCGNWNNDQVQETVPFKENTSFSHLTHRPSYSALHPWVEWFVRITVAYIDPFFNICTQHIMPSLTSVSNGARTIHRATIRLVSPIFCSAIVTFYESTRKSCQSQVGLCVYVLIVVVQNFITHKTVLTWYILFFLCSRVLR